MSSTRRSFAVSVAFALAGCASARQREDRDDRDVDGVRNRGDWDRWEGPQSQPSEWWSWVPDLKIVNLDTDGVTAYVSVRRPEWMEPLFEETVSIRGRTPGHRPVSKTFDDLNTEGRRGVLEVETAMGHFGECQWDGGGRESGIRVHLHASHVDFAAVSL